jgi:predicted DsbA family dithiol-disulfide isomerase
MNNPLMCDPETGSCEMPGLPEENETTLPKAVEKPLRVIYFTDPICSSCWGIEPQLRKLKMEYGALLDIEYHMGGLLPDWSYNSGGISKPADVASHWDEVSLYYDMPIDGDVWLEDPLDSSYPPSIAFKAAQMQDPNKALLFLRRIKEMVFLKKKNICKWEHLSAAAVETGLDPVKLDLDVQEKAKQYFQEDLQLTGSWNIKGFPTLFITDAKGNQEKIYGVKPYSVYEAAISSLLPDAEQKKAAPEHTLEVLFSAYPTITRKELSVIAGLSSEEAERVLDNLVAEDKLELSITKNGKIWKIKN